MFEQNQLYYPLSAGDENVRKNVVCNAVNVGENFYSESLSHISSYNRLLRVVAQILKWVECFKSKTCNLRDEMSVSDLNKAKVAIVKLVQVSLKSKLSSPSLQQFSPIIDNDGVVRIGGRLNRMSNSEFKNPILLPKDGLFSILVVQNIPHCSWSWWQGIHS